jgi:hypothetical protein
MLVEFPNLAQTSYAVTSPETVVYNCVAFAAGEDHRQWWPDSMNVAYWPNNVSRSETVDSFLSAFRTIGYSPCESAVPDATFEKIAIFVRDDGRPTHVARQLQDGKWASKLGRQEDIQHELNSLDSQRYGAAKYFMRRVRP